jgi:hypothetical protein
MHDVQLEDRLRSALRAEADDVPFTVTLDQLEWRLRARRGERFTRRSLSGLAAALVVAAVGVGAILLSSRVPTPPVGSSPSPSLGASASPHPSLASFGELHRSVGLESRILLRAERDADRPPVPATVATYRAGTVSGDGYYLAVFHCVGSGPFKVSWLDASGRELTSGERDRCPASPEGLTGAGLPAEVTVSVTTSPGTSWRLIVVDPVPVDGSPSHEPSTPAPVTLLPPPEPASPYPGWEPLHTLDSVGSNEPIHAFSMERRDDVRHLLVSVTCEGDGRLSITGSGLLESTVECPVGPDEPARNLVYIADEATIVVTVTASGTVGYSVLVEGNQAPLDLPAVRLGGPDGSAEMRAGCGISISLSWGYQASDSCGTTLPADPIEELALPPTGAATVRLDGWTITEAGAACGRIADGDPALFEALDGCSVQAAVGDGDVVLSGLPTGRWLVELTLGSENDVGDTFRGPFYAWIAVE